jgi:hypothetical protein
MTTVVDRYLLDRVSRERRFDDRTMEIARRLFLNREKPRKLALEYAVIHQRIYAIRRMVTEAIAGYELPPGYSEVTLRGPAELIRAIGELFDQQMSELVEPEE